MSALRPPGTATVGDVMREKLRESMEAAVTDIGRAVLPIFRKTDRGRLELVASCILVLRNKQHLLVTAAHAFDQANRSNSYTRVQGKQRQIEGDVRMTLAPADARGPDRYDCCIIQMSRPFAAALGNVRYVMEHELCSNQDTTDGHAYMALGFPVSKNKKIAYAKTQGALTKLSYAGNIAWDDALARKLKVTDAHHLFLKYERKSQDFGGRVLHSIWPPEGMSGGALFDLGKGDPLDPAWSPGPFRLAGMIIEHHAQQRRIVALKIGTVLSIPEKPQAEQARVGD
jgi:Trypsin-like peptidase domain